MATPRDQCNQHLACQPRERVVALECHSICKLIFTPRPSRCAYLFSDCWIRVSVQPEPSGQNLTN
ncbi:hypothetical protein BU57_08130 [Escherichia coli O121:H19 str. 2011C-3609]|nr:hypothetical protein BU57_08130 [Escherichia coli O121:H19 str. 2011C-3609]